jgi:predicted GH43/DUF377 family glycosyl hydrolase
MPIRLCIDDKQPDARFRSHPVEVDQDCNIHWQKGSIRNIHNPGQSAVVSRGWRCPNVAFPCAALFDEESGRIAIYYGGADTVTAIAFTQLHDVLDFLESNSMV